MLALSIVPFLAKRRRRTRRRLVAIPFTTRLTLSTLLSSTVIKVSALGNAFGEDFYCHQVTANYALSGATPTEGPLSIGYTHGDLSVAEVLEAITAELTDPDDIIAKERARRPVRKVGNFPVQAADETFRDGAMVRTGLGFSVGNDHKLDFWALNNSGATLTTGAIIDVDGVLYGRWQR